MIKISEVLQLLRELQWSAERKMPFSRHCSEPLVNVACCPICGGMIEGAYMPDWPHWVGHEEDCKLGKTIEEIGKLASIWDE